MVYVVGMEEGIFPGTASMYDEEELEEERRLCYVAMTRAREKLVMTNARQRMLYGRTSANKSSRFLDEIPAEDMRWESKPEPKFGTYDEDGFGGSRWGDDFGGGSFWRQFLQRKLEPFRRLCQRRRPYLQEHQTRGPDPPHQQPGQYPCRTVGGTDPAQSGRPG